MKTDIEIAQETAMLPIKDVAASIGVEEDDLELYGKYKAKFSDEYLKKVQSNPNGKLVLVTAINPTPAGEGKTTTTVGLGEAFGQLGKKAVIALREPSLGPCFGIKGGAAGGGYAQVVPMEDLNLHFTGDFHAITSANNLLAAMMDNHIQQGNALDIDTRQIIWKRCLDMNDRVLRNVVVGLGNKMDGVVREDHFVITVASEIMAILCLADDMEDLIAHMDITGGSAWGKLFDYLTSTLKVDYEGEVITLPAVRNLATSEDKEVRKKAYEAELASYDKIADSIAFALNNIKGQVSMLSEKKGYESPLAMTLEQCRMKKETLDAMFTAMREYLPKFWEYLKAKAKYLGYEGGLPWYEMFAPVGKMDSNYTAETARDTLVENFSHFSKELSDMMARAFAESWIDFYPHEGKVGGAFCANVTTEKQSRILTNFNGSFDSVVTLAHELGHAFHNKQIFENRILNQDYSMPVAETASTFNETHFMLSAYKKSNDPQEKLAILENLLSGTTQIICDIYSRFLFEDAVFHKCDAQFLMTNDLKEIMLDAQKQAYGDGLDQTKLHPYMWTCKGHYYSSGLSYYNFPYAFGGLFAMGLYTQFLNEGESFVPKYNALLKATATCSVEDTAKMAGIDLTKPDFWRSSLQTFANLIDEYAALIG